MNKKFPRDQKELISKKFFIFTRTEKICNIITDGHGRNEICNVALNVKSCAPWLLLSNAKPSQIFDKCNMLYFFEVGLLFPPVHGPYNNR